MMGMRIVAGMITVVASEIPNADPLIELMKLGIVSALLLWFVVWARRDKVNSDQRWEETNKQMFDAIRYQVQTQEQSTAAAKAHVDASREHTAALQEQIKITRALVEELRERPCLHGHIKPPENGRYGGS